ncbi:MAG: hypothetical protein ACLQO6_08630 [Desulfomonilaceae bacterium]
MAAVRSRQPSVYVSMVGYRQEAVLRTVSMPTDDSQIVSLGSPAYLVL